MTWLTIMEYRCHKRPRICSTCRKYLPVFSLWWLVTGFLTRLTRRVPLLVEQELPTLPKHLSSPPVFSGVRVTRSLVLCVCFVDRCLAFLTFFLPLCCLFFFDLRIRITSLWYLQTLLWVRKVWRCIKSRHPWISLTNWYRPWILLENQWKKTRVYKGFQGINSFVMEEKRV